MEKTNAVRNADWLIRRTKDNAKQASLWLTMGMTNNVTMCDIRPLKTDMFSFCICLHVPLY